MGFAYAQGIPPDYLTVTASATATRSSNFTVTVTAKSGATGATKTTETGPATLTLHSPDSGDVLATLSVPLVAGVGTLTTQQISGGSGNDTCAIRASLTGYMQGTTSTGIAVSDPPPNTFEISPASSTTTWVRAMNFSFSITAKLPDGSTNTADNGTVTLTLTTDPETDDVLSIASATLVNGVWSSDSVQITGPLLYPGVQGVARITASKTGYTSSYSEQAIGSNYLLASLLDGPEGSGVLYPIRDGLTLYGTHYYILVQAFYGSGALATTENGTVSLVLSNGNPGDVMTPTSIALTSGEGSNHDVGFSGGGPASAFDLIITCSLDGYLNTEIGIEELWTVPP